MTEADVVRRTAAASSDPAGEAEASGAPLVRVLGVRHHGPGSARSVVAALDDFGPDLLLVEGPADADPLLELAGRDDLEPPVALLAYVADDPRAAAFWPFASFSPEWQALRWASRHDVPTQFCDLPAAATLAAPDGPTDPDATDREDEGDDPDGELAVTARQDPLALLATAAGHDDPERWWDQLVESRVDGQSPFDAITDAMAELRDAVPPRPAREQQLEDRREAHMRTVLRAALRRGHRRVAVVCGAWHAPALTLPLPAAGGDAALLKGLPRRKVLITWTPWTHGRLATASGYGAGISSPGWYHHLFSAPDRPVTRWLTGVAGVLREEDLPVSSAHVIEAVRLADTLATLRGRPLAGLAEVSDATRSVLCDGDDLMLDLVTRRLVIGEALGSVPEDAPTVPLEADLRTQARRLRLKIDAVDKALDLDLRKPTDLERSRLLHRLALLGIEWGTTRTATSRNLGTFREPWSLRWRPELALDLVEASVWGTTVEAAATARLVDQARGARLADLAAAVESALLADLSGALPDLLAALDASAARDHDVAHVMEALPALARSVRYGDVRGTDTGALTGVADALLVRIGAGLPAAVVALDHEAAAELTRLVVGVDAAVATLGDPAVRARWVADLAPIADRDDVHGLLAGRLVRLLMDSAALDPGDVATRLTRALSVGVDAAAKAAWVEGFLADGGLLLVHDPQLLRLVDTWVSGLRGDAFIDVLPLLRRTFGTFTSAERRAVAAQVARTAPDETADDGTIVSPSAQQADDPLPVDDDRAAAAVATVARLLGIDA